MTQLTFHFAKPRDLVLKLHRDEMRLKEAASSGDREKIADSLFDFSNTGYCVKEWIKANSNGSFTGKDVEKYLGGTPVLDACRDICNANKHRNLTLSVPMANAVYESASGTMSAILGVSGSAVRLEDDNAPDFRVKVLLTNGSKFEVTEFAREVIEKWTIFLTRYGL